MNEAQRIREYIDRKATAQMAAGRGMTVGGDPDVGGGYTPRLNHVEQHAYAGQVLAAISGEIAAGFHLRDDPAPVDPPVEP